ncbi:MULTISPECIES: LuxR family transcriptional regulator [unclassified Massilia]|uniref:helix-turn-helix transcriptional regulator n=1 Tax=unclassified Massilia TaxID=2609279 RepID=UPI000AF1849B|nr:MULTISPECIES: LuxR family transcriptional regulator [unclassified Massilia]
MMTVDLDELMHSDTASSWGEALFSLGRHYGFEKVLFAMSGSRHARLEHAFFQTNYPRKWRERYEAERLAYVDPTVSHCLSSTLPLVWQADTFRSPAQRAMYEDGCKQGIRAGVTFPIHGPNGEFGMLTFACDPGPERSFATEAQPLLPELALVRDHAFASGVRFCPPPTQEAAPRLTPRELEVLNWVMAGKSSWEISKITGCSEATVNFHMGNIRQKFNVNTRQQAVVRAISLGLISPEDHHR